MRAREEMRELEDTFAHCNRTGITSAQGRLLPWPENGLPLRKRKFRNLESVKHSIKKEGAISGDAYIFIIAMKFCSSRERSMQ